MFDFCACARDPSSLLAERNMEFLDLIDVDYTLELQKQDPRETCCEEISKHECDDQKAKFSMDLMQVYCH
ncbi:predicted protein [Botrytis cinerea T4]|uniref:Uncharacterized protein n=1 Tax=Botryotinia fuckeliana (strain T4) TaxID=999810 RepID=G2XPJ3_BOTF4|nr:predicted protein [Botrytis cinerea T4]